MSLISWWLALAGFAWLALAMEDHHHWLVGRRPSKRGGFTLRLLGWSLLALSWGAAAASWGPALGSIAWCGLLTLAAAPLVLARTYLKPRRR
ncbi:DUF3325 domain-containing protein [Niveispirillum sp. KHB5.9]|uniref:DUF3325 domain-containing protein n=1 Tax=Niveispirillum sp. KHB5.9 TaxID=3400269 RepID=UPI003A8470AC